MYNDLILSLDVTEVDELCHECIVIGQYAFDDKSCECFGGERVDSGRFMATCRQQDGRWMIQRCNFNSELSEEQSAEQCVAGANQALRAAFARRDCSSCANLHSKDCQVMMYNAPTLYGRDQVRTQFYQRLIDNGATCL